MIEDVSGDKKRMHPVLAVEVGRLHCSFMSAEISDSVHKLISYFKKYC